MYATIRIYDEAEGLADAVAEHRDEIVGLFRTDRRLPQLPHRQDRAGERHLGHGL